jgi:hypothetical protein
MGKGFGEDLWKNVRAVRLVRDGGIEAPVRADGDRGIVVGIDAVAAGDAGCDVANARPGDAMAAPLASPVVTAR